MLKNLVKIGLILRYKQRDILPKIITVYFATSAILMTILHILLPGFMVTIRIQLVISLISLSLHSLGCIISERQKE